MPKQPVIVFEVNETLLDLDALHPTLDCVFGDPAALRLWFAHLITYSEALTLAGVYFPFTDIGAAAQRMLENAGVTGEFERRFSAQPRGHLPGWLSCLGHHRNPVGRLAGWPDPAPGQRPLGVGPQPDYLGSPRRDRPTS